MRHGLRSPLAVRLAVSLLVGLLVLPACGDGGSTVAGPSAGTPSVVATSTAPAPQTSSPSPSSTPSSDVDQELTFSYAKGVVSGSTGRVPVKLGSKVRIVVTSDVADEVHLHVYDLKRPISPGSPAEIVFTADVPGQIEAELHDARKLLVRLVIS